jgi:hypothetical protein
VVVAPASVPVRGAGGVSSRVEYQRASGRTARLVSRSSEKGGQWCAAPAGSLQYLPFLLVLPGGVVVERWTGSGVVGVVHGALLGPETTGPYSSAGVAGVIRWPVGGGCVGSCPGASPVVVGGSLPDVEVVHRPRPSVWGVRVVV